MEQLLAYLKKRAESAEFLQQVKQHKKAEKRSLLDHAKTEERASIGEIDTYIEHLYEDIADKIRGTAMILQLAQHQNNLEELIQSEPLMNSL